MPRTITSPILIFNKTYFNIENLKRSTIEVPKGTVVQAVLLFGSDPWVLSVAMESTVERTHTEFIRHITVKCLQRNPDKMWVTPGAGVVL